MLLRHDIAHTHVTLSSSGSTCERSAHICSKKISMYYNRGENSSLFGSSIHGPQTLDSEGKTEAHAPSLSTTVTRSPWKRPLPRPVPGLHPRRQPARRALTPGSTRAAPPTPRRSARLHADEDNNEDNDDDK